MTIEKNLADIKTRIAATAEKAGRHADDVELIAVSKMHDRVAVKAAFGAGQRHFGENRVQEAKNKFTELKMAHPDMVLHLIGPLQTNKADEAVRLFDVIETLDRPKLAEAVAKAIEKTGRAPRLLIEVNIGNEPQKAGIAPDELADFLTFCASLGLKIVGLMCIPPQGDEPALYFKQLKSLADTHGLAHISMGMSGDYEAAIACGATQVRVGTAIFGKRETHS